MRLPGWSNGYGRVVIPVLWPEVRCAARGVAVSYGESYNGEAVGTAPSKMKEFV